MGGQNTKDYVAILDIGSNAVRLVVYDGLSRAPVRIHMERDICSLGADLGRTGRLSPEGVVKALDSIARFSGLLKAMKIKNVQAVATAALRDAADGPDFIARVKKDFGLAIRIIEGDEEARLSALGVLMNGGGMNSLIGDYGGGSLELIWVDKGKVIDKVSLPIGSHRLHALPDAAAREEKIDAAIAGVKFLKSCNGVDFYALGGAWRSMAKAHIRMTEHPLKVLDHYALDGREAMSFARLVAGKSPAELEDMAGLSPKRVKDMTVAAQCLARVLETVMPQQLVFSGTGLREGLLYDQLPPAIKRQDPLIAFCRKAALKISRFDDLKSFGALLRWMAPLFDGQPPEFFRLLEAACLLSDSSWFEHEDYQAQHAFERTLVLPFYGLDHPGRIFIARVQYIRYSGLTIENTDANDLALIAGLAMRAAYLMTGGALSLLEHASLSMTADKIVLTLQNAAAPLRAEVVKKALDDLARVMGRAAVIN